MRGVSENNFPELHCVKQKKNVIYMNENKNLKLLHLDSSAGHFFDDYFLSHPV